MIFWFHILVSVYLIFARIHCWNYVNLEFSLCKDLITNLASLTNVGLFIFCFILGPVLYVAFKECILFIYQIFGIKLFLIGSYCLLKHLWVMWRRVIISFSLLILVTYILFFSINLNSNLLILLLSKNQCWLC